MERILSGLLGRILGRERVRVSEYYIRRIWHYFRPYLFRIIVAMISMAVVAGCTAAAAYLVKPVLDEIFINRNQQALLVLPLVILVLYLVKCVFMIQQVYQMRYASLRVLEQVRNDLFSKMVRLPMAFFEYSRVGMLMSRIVNDVSLLRQSVPEITMVFRHTFTMVALIGVAFYRDPFLATWAVVVLPLGMYPLIYFGRKLRKLTRKKQEKIADISTLLQESFSGIKVIKAFAKEDHEDSGFQAHNRKLAHIGIRSALKEAMSAPSMEMIGGVGVSLVIWYGGSQVIAGETTPGNFFSFLTALLMLYDPLKKLSKANVKIQKALAGAERIFGLLDSKEITEEDSGSVELSPPLEQLSYEGVWFAYQETTDWALRDINLSVAPQERVAIVGPSGAGKSSLVQLLPRFYDPQHGTVKINNRSLSEYTLSSLRRFIGIVSQETVLFNMSIRDNICYGLHGVDSSRLEEVCRIAFIHDRILQLPEGYDTVVGERGIILSGGEKQRITIARALLKDPPLLILDEATSALDTESERIVQKALENLMRDRTSIVIAHRLSTVLSADRIVVMEQGRVVDVGPHTDLLQRCDLYRKLYRLQFEQGGREDEEESEKRAWEEG